MKSCKKSMRERTVCFTGHREIRENIITLRNKLYNTVDELISQGYAYFGAGGARGFDTIAAETVLVLKNKYPQIHLILVLPFENQYSSEDGWSYEDIVKYHRIKACASKIVYIQKEYMKGCYYKRNRHLIDNSDVCVCYQYKNSGGTAYTTDYARMSGIRIINLAPKIHD